MPNLTPTPPPTTPSGSVEEILKEFEELAHANQECFQPPHCEEWGEGHWNAIEFAKSFITTAYTLGRSSMRDDVLAVVPEEKEVIHEYFETYQGVEYNACRSQLLDNIKRIL